MAGGDAGVRDFEDCWAAAGAALRNDDSSTERTRARPAYSAHCRPASHGQTWPLRFDRGCRKRPDWRSGMPRALTYRGGSDDQGLRVGQAFQPVIFGKPIKQDGELEREKYAVETTPCHIY